MADIDIKRLRELPQKWRGPFLGRSNRLDEGARLAYRACAAELEAAMKPLLALAEAVQNAPVGILATYPDANDRATFLYFNGKGEVPLGTEVRLVPDCGSGE